MEYTPERIIIGILALIIVSFVLYAPRTEQYDDYDPEICSGLYDIDC